MSILCGRFHNGVLIPAIGLGTWQLANSDETSSLIREGLAHGYRHVDTAIVYDNHPACAVGVQEGEKRMRASNVALKPFGPWVAVSDEEFQANFALPHGKPQDGRKAFITSKIFTADFTPKKIAAAVDRMTAELKRPVDLVLLHWPAGHGAWGEGKSSIDPKNPEYRSACWKAMEQAYADKKVRAIGVSNYAEKHLGPLIADIKARKAAGDKQATIPMVNQYEISPLLSPRRALLEIMRNNQILTTAYSTLGSSGITVTKDQNVQAIARKLGKSPPQLIIRWCLQNGYLCIPRTSRVDHAKENLDVDFEISPEDMDAINSLHTGHRGCPDPMEFA